MKGNSFPEFNRRPPWWVLAVLGVCWAFQWLMLGMVIGRDFL